MQRTTSTGQRLSLIAASAALALLAACSKPADENATVGQRIDQGVATAEQKTDQAAATMERKTDQATATVEQKMDQAGNAIERTGEKVANATADASLTAAVKTALLTAPELSSLKINVDTTGGVVTLKGEVKSANDKAQAEKVASAVTGVQQVKNDLTVNG
jgi:osmotically-inducible protein OsmY